MCVGSNPIAYFICTAFIPPRKIGKPKSWIIKVHFSIFLRVSGWCVALHLKTLPFSLLLPRKIAKSWIPKNDAAAAAKAVEELPRDF